LGDTASVAVFGLRWKKHAAEERTTIQGITQRAVEN
jgi:hypothetical protein